MRRQSTCAAGATAGFILLLAISASVQAQQPKTPARATGATTGPIPIAAAEFVNDKPVGLFYRLKVGFTSGNRLDVQTILFLAGNRITRTYPFGGGEVFDQARCNPDMCGSYEHGADQITVRWDNGQVSQWRYKRTAEGFELDGDNFKPARPLTQATLVGSWAGAANTGTSTANVYRFGADGAFSFGAGSVGSGGRYSVKGLTLTLDFSDGTQQKRTLFAAGSSEPVGLISVEGDAYRRQ